MVEEDNSWEQRIKKLVSREFDAELVEEQKISEGFSHHMYSVKINKKPFEIIVRFLNNADNRFDLSKEEFVIETLGKNGLPVPKIYAFNEKEGYMVLEKFNGSRLDKIWDSLNKEEKIKITKKLGKLLAKIHRIHFENFGYLRSHGKIKSGEEYKFKQKGKEIKSSGFLRHLLSAFFEELSLFASYPEISKEFLIKMSSYVLSKRKELDYCGKPTLIHNDFIAAHIFVEKINKEYGITGIIDFEFAESSAPEYDFIKLHRQGFFDDVELKKALEQGYGRKIDEKKVQEFRLMRDFGFARVVLSSGDKEHCDRVIKEIEEKI